MSQQLVGDEHRLGVLHVGASGHDGVRGLGGLVDEGVDDVENESGHVAGLITQVHTDEGGDLVVAAAAGAQAVQVRGHEAQGGGDDGLVGAGQTRALRLNGVGGGVPVLVLVLSGCVSRGGFLSEGVR